MQIEGRVVFVLGAKNTLFLVKILTIFLKTLNRLENNM